MLKQNIQASAWTANFATAFANIPNPAFVNIPNLPNPQVKSIYILISYILKI